jgi:hypothetical protein
MTEKAVIPAKEGTQNVRDLNELDSGSPLRSARNDGAIGLSKHHFAPSKHDSNEKNTYGRQNYRCCET